MTDTVRSTYRVLSDHEKAVMAEIKSAGQHLIDRIKASGASREISLALTKAEEAVMWAVKHVTG